MRQLTRRIFGQELRLYTDPDGRVVRLEVAREYGSDALLLERDGHGEVSFRLDGRLLRLGAVFPAWRTIAY